MKRFTFAAAFWATSAFTFAQSVKPAPGAELGRAIPLPDRFGQQSHGTVSLSTAAPDALGAVPRREKGSAKGIFMAKHNAFLRRTKEGPVGLLFLGDSITEGWINAPEIWEAHYGRYQPANFGLGADETQHLLWRIDDGELDGIRPKVVVLLIGTHNTTWNTAPQIARVQTTPTSKPRNAWRSSSA